MNLNVCTVYICYLLITLVKKNTPQLFVIIVLGKTSELEV